jgi:hypothetical protein
MKKGYALQSFSRFKTILLLTLICILSCAFGNRLKADYSVTGPALLCTSGVYTVQNYTNETPVWSSSSNLTLTSTQGQNPATFSANGNGLGSVTATITCCGNQFVKSVTVWVGPPVIDYVVDEGKYPEQHLFDIAFYPAYYDISDPEYSLEVDYPGEVESCSMGWAQVYLPGDPHEYGFILESSNTCGSDYLQFYFDDVWDLERRTPENLTDRELK